MQFKRTYAPAHSPVGDWERRGACRSGDPELFFGPEDESRAAAAVREAAARAVCLSCPVVQECRSWSLTAAISYGVWGGLGEDERQALVADMRAVA